MRRVVVVGGVTLVAAVIVLSGMAWHAAGATLYPQRIRETQTPADFGMAFREVTLRTSDGVRLAGWYVPAQGCGGGGSCPPAPVVILCHGVPSSREAELSLAQMFHGHGFAAFLFDFRRQGVSGGTVSTLGAFETRDLEAAVSWVARAPGVDATKIAVLGRSLGAAVAIDTAAFDPRIRAVVSDSSFASATEVLSLPSWARPLDVVAIRIRSGANLDAVRPVDLIGRISPRSVLIIQGSADRLVPPGDAYRLFAAAGEPKQVWIVPGAAHAEAFDVDPAGYERTVVGFLDQALGWSR